MIIVGGRNVHPTPDIVQVGSAKEEKRRDPRCCIWGKEPMRFEDRLGISGKVRLGDSGWMDGAVGVLFKSSLSVPFGVPSQ